MRKITYLSKKQYMPEHTHPFYLNRLLCDIYNNGGKIPTAQLKKIRNIYIHPNQNDINDIYRPFGDLELLDNNTLYWLKTTNKDIILNKKQRKEIRKKKAKGN